jgi:CheY-like chemotaxis protein/HPt (histidine-containing phosphotransfer) domain-containing protein
VLRFLNKPVRRADLFRAITGALAALPGEASSPLPLHRPPPVHPGRHVLLVEDSAINQYVATAMLERLGVTVTLAVNGIAAVEQVLSRDFDLVLMDCHMPEMDGFEATRRIREWQRAVPHQRNLPIIALTANALTGDRDACLAAGMSDYLAKPITGSNLREMLARHLRSDAPTIGAAPASGAAPPVGTATPSSVAPPAVFDPAVLASLPMVADGSDPDFASQVLGQYRQGSRDAIDGLGRAVAEGDGASALRCVHTLKSASAQVGAEALAQAAEALESQLRAAAMPTADAMARLLAEHGRALEAIAVHTSRSARAMGSGA